MGLRTVLLTGDNGGAAEAVSKALGIDDVRAEVLPEEKAAVVASLRSHRTYAKIRQNLFWAFIYNLVGVPLAAFGYSSPMIAGAAMAFSSVSVVSNALLLRRWKASR